MIISDFIRFFVFVSLAPPTPLTTINGVHLNPLLPILSRPPRRIIIFDLIVYGRRSSGGGGTTGRNGEGCTIPIEKIGLTGRGGIGGYELQRDGV